MNILDPVNTHTIAAISTTQNVPPAIQEQIGFESSLSYKKISPANACTFNIDGSAGPSANVFPFRAYVALTKNSTNAKIIASFDEDAETTGIKELLISNDKSPVYDLNGRVVNENSQKSGIYIKNGKKYVK